MHKIVKNNASELLDVTNPTLHVLKGVIVDKSNIYDDVRILSLMTDIEYGVNNFSNGAAFKSWNANVVIDMDTGRFILLPKHYGILIDEDKGYITNNYIGRYNSNYEIIMYQSISNYKPPIEYRWDNKLKLLGKKRNRAFVDSEYVAFSICGLSALLFGIITLIGLGILSIMVIMTIRGGI